MRRFAASATFRLAASFSLAFLLVTTVLGVTIYRAMRAELGYELDQRILSEQSALLREAGGTLQSLLAAVTVRQKHGGEDMRYSIVDASGRSRLGPALDTPPRAGWADARMLESDGAFDPTRVLVSPLPGGTFLVVGADPESIERLDDRMIPLFAIAFGLMAAVGAGGGFLMSVALRRRLDAITGTAEAIIGGDMTKRMPVGSASDEFDRLSATLNRMLDRIEALVANLRQVSSDIAHDLRTPLTRLRQKLELTGGETDVTVLRAAIDDAGTQADELLALFTAILGISEVEAGSAALRFKPFDLSALVTDLADSYIPAAEDGGRALTSNVTPGLLIDGQRELVAQMLVNLLDNALRHTPSGASIAMSLDAVDDRAVLTVADNGPGIATEDRERVFERFVRLDRSRTTPGHGLGLRLVAAIAAAHRATIALEDNHPGVKMMISFERSAA